MALSVRAQAMDNARFDILEAAAICFMERGYAAASIDEVARSLDATKGRIYHYYASKADLFADVFKTGMDMNYDAIAPWRETATPTLERWREMALIHVLQMMRTKPFQRAVWIGVEMHLRGATTPEQRDVFNGLIAYRSRYGDVFRDIIAKGREEGIFCFEDLSVTNQVMFMALNSPIFWYSPRLGETPEDTHDIANQVVAFALGGLTRNKEHKA